MLCNEGFKPTNTLGRLMLCSKGAICGMTVPHAGVGRVHVAPMYFVAFLEAATGPVNVLQWAVPTNKHTGPVNCVLYGFHRSRD